MSATVAVILAGVVLLLVILVAVLIDARRLPKQDSEDRTSDKGI